MTNDLHNIIVDNVHHFVIDDETINRRSLLGAIATVESTGGSNNYPRLESYWMPDGEVRTVQGKIIRGKHPASNIVVRTRFDKFGMGTACSFSSWQILYHTAADLGFTREPYLLWSDEIAVLYVCKRLTQLALKFDKVTVEQFADAWNSGNFRDEIIPERYISDVVSAYNQLEGI